MKAYFLSVLQAYIQTDIIKGEFGASARPTVAFKERDPGVAFCSTFCHQKVENTLAGVGSLME